MPVMPRSVVYSAEEDLLLGNIPLPSYASAEKFINDAADEIDSVLGFLYVTPIDMSDGGTVLKPARLLVKRISNWLATGRLVLAVAAGGEQRELHAYGADLVKQATILLEKLGAREIILEGADPVDNDIATFVGPQIYNKDPESNVEAFYDRVTDPRYNAFGYYGDAERGVLR